MPAEALRPLLGAGPLAPLRRSGGDFVLGADGDLVVAALRRLLASRRRSLPWRPRFGASPDAHRHEAVPQDLGIDITDALAHDVVRYEQRLQIMTATFRQVGTEWILGVQWAVRELRPGGDVLIGPNNFEVRV